MVDVGSIVSKLKLDISGFATKMQEAEQMIKDSEKKFSGFTDIGNRMEGVGRDITTKVTLPIVGAGIAMGKLYTDFETGMDKISTVANTANVSVEELGDGVMELSNSSGLGTGDLQAGLYDVLSAGVATEASLGYLEVAVKSAKGGFTDTATAVDGLTSTLNAYGMSAEEVNVIANQMMVAQNLGKTTFGEMAGAIGKVAPTANALNVSTKELFSSLAVLTANGIGTSEAVTGLKATFSNIAKPTKGATDAAQALGVEFSADALAAKGFSGFLGDVKEALARTAPELASTVDEYGRLTAELQRMEAEGDKSSDMYKNFSDRAETAKGKIEILTSAGNSQVSQFATMFGSVEALNTVLTLTSDQGIALFSDSMDAMAKDTDYVDEAFNKMSDSSGNQLVVSFNKLKNAGTEFGQSITPIVSKVADVISKVADALGSLSTKQQESIVNFGLVAIAVGPAIMLFGKMITSVQTLATGYKAVKTGIDLMKNSQILQDAVTKVATVTQGAFNAVMSANPIALVIIAIVALVAGFVLLYNKCEWFREGVQAVWGAIKDFFLGLWDWAVAFFSEWGTVILAVLAPFMALPLLIAQHWETIKVALGILWEWLKLTVKELVDAFIKNWTDFWASIEKVNNDIKKFVTDTWEAIKKKITDLMNSIVDFFKKSWEGMKETASNLVTGIKEKVVTTFTGMMTFISELPTKLKAFGADMFTKMRDGVVSTVSKVYDSVKTGVGQAVDYLTGLPTQAFTWGKHMLEGFADGVMATMHTVIDKVKAVAEEIKSFMGFTVPEQGPLHEYEEWMPHFMEGMAKGVESKKHKLIDSLKGVAEDMKLQQDVNFMTGSTGMGQVGYNRTKGEQPITLILELDGRQVAKVTAPHMTDMIRLKTGVVL